MLTAIIDYESGNLHSAEKAFQRMARETGAGDVVVTDKAEVVARADRIVLPGDGAFPACAAALGRSGCFEAMVEAVERKGRPFLGICVGMQLMAREGHEFETVAGLGWIDGAVERIRPSDPDLKIPHMGWNEVRVVKPHPVLAGIEPGDEFYFVHGYYPEPADADLVYARTDYETDFACAVGRDNYFATQFHPEKSGRVGLRLLEAFAGWDGRC